MFIGNMEGIMKYSLTEEEFSYFKSLIFLNVFGYIPINYTRKLFISKIGYDRYKILQEKFQKDFEKFL